MPTIDDCMRCNKPCPQAKLAHDTAIGRMYATKELLSYVKKVYAGQLVEVVHSKWSCDDEDGFDNLDWHCDRCGGSIGYRCGNPVFSNYCPTCGADMRGGTNGI